MTEQGSESRQSGSRAQRLNGALGQIPSTYAFIPWKSEKLPHLNLISSLVTNSLSTLSRYFYSLLSYFISGCSGLHCCVQAFRPCAQDLLQWLLLLQRQASGCGTQAQQLWLMGSRDAGFSMNADLSWVDGHSLSLILLPVSRVKDQGSALKQNQRLKSDLKDAHPTFHVMLKLTPNILTSQLRFRKMEYKSIDTVQSLSKAMAFSAWIRINNCETCMEIQKTSNSQNNLGEKRKLKYHALWFETILQSHVIKIVYTSRKNRHIDQWNRETRNEPTLTWTTTRKRIKLDDPLTPCTKINFKWIKGLNVNTQTS